ncbi:class I SAM-dependent methyltransferase [Ottowia sp. GY511]|uniref:Class I SAM-dependent methyltransferase n=1 Tax=Ottowia flava TaxID=2675430 RepID=A0ABW4KWA2_9BURK|nr:class I SAM-dependent methyltransferase [Ottowia sp. GY511]TXK26239.1 class I SAM-dependent methyltransferase [Ottowia sp. GY511]
MTPWQRHRRDWLAGSAALVASGWLSSQPALAQAPTSESGSYQPQRGQFGKDVIWIPTPDVQVNRMLRLAQLTPQDFLIDLGSGDGKIVIAAAREGAQGLGIEYNPDMVQLSRRLAAQAGVGERARFEKADIFESDFSRATVITMYLLPHLNLRLRPRIMALKPGTRVVSHEFRMGRWQPDETSRVGHAAVHLWLVPANAGGDWELSFSQRTGPVTVKLHVEQTFQDFRGTLTFAQFQTGVREPKVAGSQIRFGFIDEDGHLRRFVGHLSGDEMRGVVYDLTANGARTPFAGRRTGLAPPIGGSGPAPESEAESLGAE